MSSLSNDLYEAMGDVQTEFYRQIEIHGVHNHPVFKGIGLLGEEFGEVCSAANEGKLSEVEDELAHVAATAISMIIAIRRERG
jgi:NTP pyrophosphatase (non-canonical NTP hydrolase)